MRQWENSTRLARSGLHICQYRTGLNNHYIVVGVDLANGCHAIQRQNDAVAVVVSVIKGDGATAQPCVTALRDDGKFAFASILHDRGDLRRGCGAHDTNWGSRL